MENLLIAGNGALFGSSLLVAIGPQNTFVLRQGLMRRHVGPVVLVCVASDMVLIGMGALGLGRALTAKPAVIQVVRLVGAALLLAYGVVAAKRAIRDRQRLASDASAGASLTKCVSTCLAFTWLNPHVYLDTVVLLGAVASSQGEDAPWFAAGAMSASCIWFVGLGFGARLLRPLFVRPNAPRLLDASIAVVMLFVSVLLLDQGLSV